jgi:hypothetical protein
MFFAITIFLSAFLLFQVQPLIAKFILPWFGGAPNVWTTCMLFFQIVLLGGYLYADLLTRFFRLRTQWLIHAVLLVGSVCLLPIIPADSWKPAGTESPTLRIMLLLLATIGLPYFLLSTTGPLVQAWFGQRYVGRSPYRLFALSNLGSLLALLSFPFVFEPIIPTATHAAAWGWGYILFALCCIITGGLTQRGAMASTVEAINVASSPKSLESKTSSPTINQPVLAGWRLASALGWWLLLSLVPSVMLLATTNHICQDVAVIPFLWIAPLSLYLITFIICFDRPEWYRREVWGVLFVVVLAIGVYCMFNGRQFPVLWQVGIFLTLLFVASMVCHGELACMRPGVKHLTLFYLMISVGGALGGVFVVLVAPQIFIGFDELYWVLFASAVLAAGRWLLSADQTTLYRIFLFGSAALLISVLTLMTSDVDLLEELRRNLVMRIALGINLLLVALAAVGHRLTRQVNQSPQREMGWRNQIAERLIPAAAIVVVLAIAVAFIGWPVELADHFPLLAGIALMLIAVAGLICQGEFIRSVTAGRLLATGFLVLATLAAGTLLYNKLRQPRPDLSDRSRNFYGLLAIEHQFSEIDGELLTMMNGQINHGFQYAKPESRMIKTGHYGEKAGIGLAISLHPRRQANQPIRLGVVGLGAGTMSAHTRAGDAIVYYEINPDCVEMAYNKFFFLTDAPASDRTEVYTGDGRILLERQLLEGKPQQFDVLVIDAFSGASIPQHLFTKECFELYRQHLKPDGVIACHISNAHLNLRPVAQALADSAGFELRLIEHNPVVYSTEGFFQKYSLWALFSNNGELLNHPQILERHEPWNDPQRVLWTDDFGGLWQVFKF